MNSKLKAGCMALAVSVLAPVSGSATAAVISMPPEQRQGAVGYITGGVGDREARLFERQLHEHPLAIELLQHAGKAEEFTAGAHVRIADVHGNNVLDTKADGPFMLVDLPPGRYSVAATLRSDTLKRSSVLVVPHKPARVTFEFPTRTDG